jgi:hypothetical protein
LGLAELHEGRVDGAHGLVLGDRRRLRVVAHG